MRQTVVGVFDRLEAARQAADSLGVSGFGPGSVLVSAASEDEAELGARSSSARDDEEHDGGVIDSVRSFFAEVFGPSEWSHQHHEEYAEAVRRGAVVVKVEVHDEAHLEMARETLQSAGAVDIEERVAGWREEGWDGGAVAAPYAEDSIARMGGEDSSAAMRAVSHRGVRVYARDNGAPAQGALELGAGQGSAEAAAPIDPDTAPRVDALELLGADHDRIRRLFADYQRLAEPQAPAGERAALAERVCVELTVHAALEEEIFYPAARGALMPTHLVDEASVEHSSARELIERIRAMQPDEELYDATVRVLGEYIDHHLREEEGELFPAVRATSLDLAELGLEMSDRKAELMAQFAQDLRV